LTAGDFKD